jgi:hypothetical protein
MSSHNKILNFPFYPILIGIYAVLFLWSANIGQVMLNDTLRSLGASFGVSLSIFLLCLLLVRNRYKAALISAWLLIVLFFYGHLFSLVDGTLLGRHRFFYPLVGLLSLGIIFFILRIQRDLRTLSSSLNLITVAMLVMVIVPIASYEVRYGNLYANKNHSSITPNPNLPDVYYIILDGYTRSDELASEYQYDNSSFIQSLKQMGFYIPNCAFSNYPVTTASLSSSMNMVYLDTLGISEKAQTDSFDQSLASLIVKSKLRQELQGMGYQTVAFRGYLPALDLRDAEYYFNYEEQKLHTNLLMAHRFERLLMRTSALRFIVEAYESNPDSIAFLPGWLRQAMDMQADLYTVSDMQWYLQSKYTFDTLPTIQDLPGKKFVYAHFYSTHVPYVFNEDGSYAPQQTHNDEASYANTVRYTSQRILQVIQTILQKSKVKPVIIIQADHGKGNLLLHNKILNAYYFPDGNYSRLYKTITPVNSFRVVLDQFFQRSYPLLPDTLLVREEQDKKVKAVFHQTTSCDLK